MLFKGTALKKYMALRNSIILLFFVMVLFAFASCERESGGWTFLGSPWHDSSVDIENLARVSVSGSDVTLPVQDDHITSLLVTIGQGTGMCSCDSSGVSFYACFDSKHAACSLDYDSCFCRTSDDCPGGIKAIPGDYTLTSCRNAGGTPVYDPSFGSTVQYNACCLPLSESPPPGNGDEDPPDEPERCDLSTKPDCNDICKDNWTLRKRSALCSPDLTWTCWTDEEVDCNYGCVNDRCRTCEEVGVCD
jgi:hypothetical protein